MLPSPHTLPSLDMESIFKLLTLNSQLTLLLDNQPSATAHSSHSNLELSILKLEQHFSNACGMSPHINKESAQLLQDQSSNNSSGLSGVDITRLSSNLDAFILDKYLKHNRF